MNSDAERALPKYRCHKEVWALKIKAIAPLPWTPCGYKYNGQAVCGYPQWQRMHNGTSDPLVPPNGRHDFVGEKSVGVALITPEDPSYPPFGVDEHYIDKHAPKAGGYYVVYADGYKSFSPADAFEGGYTRI